MKYKPYNLKDVKEALKLTLDIDSKNIVKSTQKKVSTSVAVE